MEVPEFYADQFTVTGSPYGVVLTFRRGPTEPGPQKIADVVGKVWMSYEYAKTLAFILCRHIKEIESKEGISYPLPLRALSGMSIGPEDWDAFWKTYQEPR